MSWHYNKVFSYYYVADSFNEDILYVVNIILRQNIQYNIPPHQVTEVLFGLNYFLIKKIMIQK